MSVESFNSKIDGLKDLFAEKVDNIKEENKEQKKINVKQSTFNHDIAKEIVTIKTNLKIGVSIVVFIVTPLYAALIKYLIGE
jgi:hypothetical protein